MNNFLVLYVRVDVRDKREACMHGKCLIVFLFLVSSTER